MEKIRFIFIGIVVVIILLYAIPNPDKTFNDLYEGEDASAEKLRQFRQQPLKTIAVNGERWNYLVTGTGTRTILFLHGMSGAYDIWFQQIEALQADYRIISVTYPPVSDLHILAQGILSILDEEKTEKVLVVGSSLGGYVAQYLVARHSDRIEKAVFGNTFPPNTIIKDEYGNLARIIPLLPEWVVMYVFRQNIRTKAYPASGYHTLTKAYLLEQNYGRGKKKQLLARLHCVMNYFELPDQPPVPILIIASDNDNVVPPSLTSSMYAVYPTASTYRFPDAGHFPYLNRPEEYTRVLKNFFATP